MPARWPSGAAPDCFLGAIAAAGLGWGWFEAGWVRLRELELELPGLPAELDGLRIAHLSDFHLGVPLARRARGRAGGGLGRRAPPGSRRDHRRPAHAPAGRAAAARARRAAAGTGLRGARQSRHGDLPRPAGARLEPAEPRAGGAAAGRGRARRAARPQRLDRGRAPADDRPLVAEGRSERAVA